MPLPWTAFISKEVTPAPASFIAATAVRIRPATSLDPSVYSWIAIAFVGAWVTFVTWRLTRLAFSHIKLRALANGGETMAISASVPVRIVDANVPPATFGFFRPVILVPRRILGEISPVELQMILEHEQRHIARRDYLAHLIKSISQAILVFSPFIHRLARTFVEDMELSCDALVIETGYAVKDYGGLLLRLATELGPRTDLVSSGLFVSNSFISRRIHTMKTANGKSRRAVALGAFGIFALIGAPTVSSLGLEGAATDILAPATDSPDSYAYEAKLTTVDNRNSTATGTGKLGHGARDITLGSMKLQITTSKAPDGWRFIAELTDQTTGAVVSRNVIITDDNGAEIKSSNDAAKKSGDVKFFTLSVRPGRAKVTGATFDTSSAKGDTIVLNFSVPTNIKDIIKTMAQASGKAVILGRDIDAKVTVVSERPLPKQEAYQALLAALSQVNLKAIDEGKSIRIVRAQ
jgi:beta-lactamase regulating signal transducer with metallopeptidase domain